MNKLRLLIILVFSGIITLNAKEEKRDIAKAAEAGYMFEDINVAPTTDVKNQYRTGTCWAFSTLSMFESDLLRLGKGEVDLSEMFIVRYAYTEKAAKHVRLHGNLNFSPGGAFHDVTNMIRKYGIVPELIYDGLNYGESIHVHGEMDKVLKEQVEAVVDNPNKKISTAWDEAFEATLDSYLGEIPENFEYEGEEYTPLSFARDYVGLDMDDYVEITSFSHHPFYEKFILEVPDNWSWDMIYNVPLNEMQEVIDNAVKNGFTVAWAADISEKGFSSSKLGVALVNDSSFENISELVADGDTLIFKSSEVAISQEMRQEAFDNYETTDDHGMHIIGTAVDQNGEEYYKVKNSWGNYNKFDGFFYASKPYVNYKTTCIMVHKDAIPKHIRKKLDL